MPGARQWDATKLFYSDLNAIWHGDPTPILEEMDVDLAFQPGSLPNHIK